MESLLPQLQVPVQGLSLISPKTPKSIDIERDLSTSTAAFQTSSKNQPSESIPAAVDMGTRVTNAQPESLSVAPFKGYLNYAQLLRLRQTSEAAIPTDEIDGLPLAQLFDEYAYLRDNPDVATDVAHGNFLSGYEHFVTQGLYEGRDPSVLYSEIFYLANNQDVQQAVEDGIFRSGLEHFLNFGHQEHRNPSFRLISDDYLTQNPDVTTAIEKNLIQSAFEHYIEFGANEEMRLPKLSFAEPNFDSVNIPNSGLLYNEAFYLRNNLDVAEAVHNSSFTDGLDHFTQYGQYELRNPSSDFNHANYVSSNSDVQSAIDQGLFASGFDHYIQFGRFEYRSLSLISEPLYLPINSA